MKNIKLNEIQNFVKNFIFKIVYSLTSLAVGIMMTSYLSRTLEVEGFGRLNFLMTYASYFSLFASLGMDIVAVRYIAQDNTIIKQMLGAVIPAKLILSLAFFLIMISPLLYIQKMQHYGVLVVIFSFPIILNAFSPQFVFEGTKKLEFPTTINLVSIIVNLIFLYLLVKSKNDIIMIGIITIALSCATLLLTQVVVIYKYGWWKFSINSGLFKVLITQGMVIGFIQIISQFISYIDIIILEFFTNSTSVGLYSAAYRAMFLPIGFLVIIHNLMITILYENMHYNFSAYQKYFDKYIKLLIFVTFGGTALLIILAEPFLKIFYDLTTYHKSILCFRILSLNLFFWAVNSPLNTGLLTARKEKILLRIVSIQLLANILANMILIPKYGIYGSSVATVITEIVGFPIYIIIFNKIHRAPILRFISIAAASIIPMAVLVYFLDMHFILRAIIGIIAMVIFAVLFRGYTIKEILEIRKNLFKVEKHEY